MAIVTILILVMMIFAKLQSKVLIGMAKLLTLMADIQLKRINCKVRS